MRRLGSEEVARWERCEGSEVVRWEGWKGGRVVKWQGWRFLAFLKSGGHRVSPRFHLFVSDVDQQRNEERG